MADTKITALTALTAADPANDVIPIVDVSDTTMAASGTTKKISVNNILSSSPTASGALTVTGLVTAGSATITGAATVGTTLGVTGVSTLTGNAFANGSATVAGGTPGAFANAALTINNRGGVSDLSLISLGYRPNGTVLNGAAYIGFITTSGAGNLLGDLIFGTRSVTTDTAPTERYRIDSTGVATWSNVGGVAGTAMTLNATGLGVGTSPATGVKLDVNGFVRGTSGAVFQGANNISSGAGLELGYSGSYSFLQSFNRTGAAYLPIRLVGSSIDFDIANSVKATIDASGNVGIGVTPSAWGGSYKALQLQNVARSIAATGAGVGDLTIAFNAIYDSTDSRWEYAGTGDKAGRYSQTGSGNHRWFVSNTAGTAGNEITDFASAAMTLDASGFLRLAASNASSAGSYWLQVKNTGASSNAVWLENLSGNDRGIIVFKHDQATGATSGTMAVFQNGGGSTVGSITSTNTATAYNIASDYRLKESVKTLSGGIARISALKPSIYKWKSDGSSGEGFLAHELAEVVPLAVTGEKDAVNEDGTIKPQQVDLSKVVPVLVAAIQELTARVQTLETR